MSYSGSKKPLVRGKSFTVLAPGRNIVLSLVLSLAHSPQLRKQYFVNTDDMHPPKLFSAHGSLEPTSLNFHYLLLFTQNVSSFTRLPTAKWHTWGLKIHKVCYLSRLIKDTIQMQLCKIDVEHILLKGWIKSKLWSHFIHWSHQGNRTTLLRSSAVSNFNQLIGCGRRILVVYLTKAAVQ